MKHFLVSLFSGAFGAILVLAGLNYALAAWTGPTATPPDQNTPAPLNAGPLGQTKLGGLELGLAPGIANALLTLNGKVGFNTTSPVSNLELTVKGNVGATAYCDENGNNCVNGGSLAPPPPANPDPLAAIKEKYGLQKWPSYIMCTMYNNGGTSIFTLTVPYGYDSTDGSHYVGYSQPGVVSTPYRTITQGQAQNGYYVNLIGYNVLMEYKMDGSMRINSSSWPTSIYGSSPPCPTSLPLNGNILQP